MAGCVSSHVRMLRFGPDLTAILRAAIFMKVDFLRSKNAMPLVRHRRSIARAPRSVMLLKAAFWFAQSGGLRGCDGNGDRPMNLTRTKTIEQSIADTEEPEHQLRKELGPVQLTVFGVGVIIGTGIFVLTGAAAGEKAGPAVALSFVFSGIACALAALCYAEFASTVPVAGSAYTFSYASLGELVAWIIGWDLILELALGASTVAVGWSTYFADVMKGPASPS
jgi:amino acid permease